MILSPIALGDGTFGRSDRRHGAVSKHAMSINICTAFNQAFRRFKTMNAIGLLFVLAIGCFAPARPNPAPVSDASSDAAVEELRLTSRIFGNSRSIRVFLPPGYNDALNA